MPLQFIAFLWFSVLALASRHVNAFSSGAATLSNPFQSNTRLLLGQCAARGLLHSQIPLTCPTILPVILPSCWRTRRCIEYPRHLDCAQQIFSTGKIGTFQIRPRLPLRAPRCTKTVLTGPLQHHPTLSRFFAKGRELSQLSQNFRLLSRDLRPRKKTKFNESVASER